MADEEQTNEKASLCERVINGTLGMALGTGGCGIQIWTYGILPYIPNHLAEGKYFDTGIDILAATAIVTLGVLGAVGSYSLLKDAVKGKKVW